MICEDVSLYAVVNKLTKTVNEIIELLNEFNADVDPETINQMQEEIMSLQTEIVEKYGEDNPPPYPVERVNGKNGDVWVDYIYSPDRKSNMRVTREQEGRVGILNSYGIQNNITASSEIYWKIDDAGTLVPYFSIYANGKNNKHQLYSNLNPPPYPVSKVNGKTGKVVLSLSDILEDSAAQVKLCTATEFTGNTIETWNALYDEGYRIVGVVNDDATKIDYIYMLKQDENNHQPIGFDGGGGGEPSDAYTPTNPPPYPVTSVNNQTGAVNIDVGYTADNPPPYPVTSVNNQTGAVNIDVGYTADNPPPYPVTSVNNQTGAVNIDVGYTADNPPPYPVTSVNNQTGAVNIDVGYTSSNPPPYPVKSVNGKTGAVNIDVGYTSSNPPPYPVTSVNGKTGAVTIETSGIKVASITANKYPANNTDGSYAVNLSGITYTNIINMMLNSSVRAIVGFCDISGSWGNNVWYITVVRRDSLGDASPYDSTMDTLTVNVYYI